MSRRLNVPQLAVVVLAAVAAGLALKFQFQGTWWEFAAFVTGVVAVYLVSREHILNWPIGIVNVSIYAFVFFDARLYADMSLQVVYLVMQIHGWIQWRRGGVQATELRISRLSAAHWGFMALVWAAGTAIYFPIIRHFNGAAPFFDSLLTVGSLIAQALQNRKKLEHWLLWIGLDIAFIPLYLSRGLTATAVLYGIFFGIAVSGFVQWRRTYEDDKRMATPPPP